MVPKRACYRIVLCGCNARDLTAFLMNVGDAICGPKDEISLSLAALHLVSILRQGKKTLLPSCGLVFWR